MNEFKNILVVRTDRIGDVVLTTPAIQALRNAYPYAQITMLLSPLTVDLLTNCNYVNNILVDDRNGVHKGLIGYINLVKMIRCKKFDCAIIFHTKKRTNLLCFLAGIKNRIGYKNNKFGFFLNRPVLDDRHWGIKHESAYCLDLLKSIDVYAEHLDLHVSVHSDAEKWMTLNLANQNLSARDLVITIHPGASDSSKMWPEERFIELMNELNKKHNSLFVLIGSSNLTGVACRIASKVEAQTLDLTGKTTVRQLISVLNSSHMLISNDSGPVHIASALDKPVVSIFTRNQPGINPERWQPLGEKSRTVSPLENNEISFKKAGEKGDMNPNEIPTSMVLEAVDSLFKLC